MKVKLFKQLKKDLGFKETLNEVILMSPDEFGKNDNEWIIESKYKDGFVANFKVNKAGKVYDAFEM